MASSPTHGAAAAQGASVVRRGGECFDIPINPGPERRVGGKLGTALTQRRATQAPPNTTRPTEPPPNAKRPVAPQLRRVGSSAGTTTVGAASSSSALIELDGGDGGRLRHAHSAGDLALAAAAPSAASGTPTQETTSFPLRPSQRGAVPSAKDTAAAAAPRGGGGGESDADEDADADDDKAWIYEAPPDMQRTFSFPEDGLLFSSAFDSGNLVQMERLGPMRYNCYVCPDCGNSPKQTNNKQWFHFSVRGGVKGETLTLTIVSLVNSKMYSFNWTPVAAVFPQRPGYARINTRVVTTKLDGPAVTPGYPDLSPKPTGALQAVPEPGLITIEAAAAATASSSQQQQSSLASADVASPLVAASGGGVSRSGPPVVDKPPQYVNLTFDVKFEFDCPLAPPSASSSSADGGSMEPGVYIASNHPYSYAKLQRHIAGWRQLASNPPPCTSEQCGKDTSVYLHHEVLCKTLDGRNVDLLTITGVNGMSKDLEPPLDANGHFPASMSASCAVPRPFVFPSKEYVVLTARVHPGEAPSSHILHGCVEMLLSRSDPRAAALRNHFVFVIVPMINPDGVARGHSRADTTGQNLNRKYRNPSEKKHPAIFGIRQLLHQLHKTGRLGLFIDMHAHANKRGAFFYGNAMRADHQVLNLLYAKLVSLNSAHFDFPASNFSETNMFAVGKNGEGKDSSSRVTLFQDCGVVNCYTLESSYVCGVTCNPIAALPGVPGEEVDTLGSTPSPKYSPATFAELGRGLLAAWLDFRGVNPCSRLALTPFNSLRGVATWVQRALLVDAWEQVRKHVLLRSGQSLSSGAGGGASSGGALGNAAPVITATSGDPPPSFDARELPAVVTTRPSKFFPPTTTTNMAAIAGGGDRDVIMPVTIGRSRTEAGAANAAPSAPSKGGSRVVVVASGGSAASSKASAAAGVAKRAAATSTTTAIPRRR